MGNGASHPEPTPPEGIKRLNDSVWELYSSPEGNPSVEVIFFHGLQLTDYERQQTDFKNAFWRTWVVRNSPSLVWPRDWLSESFPRARILSVTYSYPDNARLGLDLYALGEMLVNDIVLSQHHIGTGCPVILVGHDLGGLVIKQFILSIRSQMDNLDPTDHDNESKLTTMKTFLEHMSGVFYYGTAYYLRSSRVNLRKLISSESPLAFLAATSGTKGARLNEEFRKLRRHFNVRAQAIDNVEGIPTRSSWFVGPTVSILEDVDEPPYQVNASHDDICKPESYNSPIFTHLSKFIASALPNWNPDDEQYLYRVWDRPLSEAATQAPRWTQIGDRTGVYKLYEGTTRAIPTVDIMFFHGLQVGDFKNAFWKTWLSHDKQVVWPTDWLSKTFPDARIFTISYDSSANLSSRSRGHQQLDMYSLGEKLVSDIILTHNIGQKCPIILVGHSLGGLIIKQFILSSIKERDLLKIGRDKRENNDDSGAGASSIEANLNKISTFIEHLRGVFYYGTPHQGSEIANLLRWIPRTIIYRSQILQFLETLDTSRSRINEEFRRTRENLKVLRAYAVAEGLPVGHWPFKSIVVPASSACHDVDSFRKVQANHLDVCKPESMGSSIFTDLTAFIASALADSNPEEEQPQLPDPRGNLPRSKAAAALLPDAVSINGSLWQLHDGRRPIPTMDILFFHGLQLRGSFEEAYWKTWLSRDGKVVWPRDFLREAFPDERIFSVSYDSSARQNPGQPDRYHLGAILINDIIMDRTDIGQHCPVFLVGYGVGGIIIKQFILAALNERSLLNAERQQKNMGRIDRFIDNFRGVLYYDTPHRGSRVADLAKWIPCVRMSPIFKLLMPSDRETARISYEFSRVRKNLLVKAKAVVGYRPTKFGRFSAVVVEEESARYDIDEFYAVSADHYEISRPKSMLSTEFTALRYFIAETLRERGPQQPRSDPLEESPDTGDLTHEESRGLLGPEPRDESPDTNRGLSMKRSGLRKRGPVAKKRKESPETNDYAHGEIQETPWQEGPEPREESGRH